MVGISSEDHDWQTHETEAERLPKFLGTYPGGTTRAQTVLNGLKALATHARDSDWVLVHDAVRPCVRLSDIDTLVNTVEAGNEGGLLALPVADTVKRAGKENQVVETVPRKDLWRALTPQIFRIETLRMALEKSLSRGADVTDEAAAIEAVRWPSKTGCGACGQYQDYPAGGPCAGGAVSETTGEKFRMMRIGHGYDVHALVAGRDLILGGVKIPHTKGLAGHSDADALIHAVCDACLGAAGLGDIGQHFPDSDPQYKNIDSRILLRKVKEAIQAKGWKVANVDATIVAQAPKLAPYMLQMAQNLTSDLGVSTDCVNIKASTTEKLGFAGREEGIAAHAVVLLEK